MQKSLFFYCVGFLIIFSSMQCGESNGKDNGSSTTNITTSNTEQISANGFAYIHHVQNEGRKPQVGEYAYFNLDAYGFINEESPLFHVGSGENTTKILAPEQVKGFTNPTYDVLPLMAIGDSLSVKLMTEKVQNLPPEFANLQYINYHLKLTDIKTPEENNQLQIEKFNKKKEQLIAAQARMDKIVSDCQKALSDYKSGNLNNNLTETSSGLKYIIHEEGKGKVIKKGGLVDVLNYTTLMDGTVIENIFESGSIKTISVGRADNLPGLDEAFSYLKYGGKATLFVPYQLAYGTDGFPPTIPAKSDIMMYIELLNY